MITGKLFKNGRSQAVRLPKECRFEGTEVGIVKMGDMVMLFPPEKSKELLQEGLEGFSEDFMRHRGQPQKSDRRPRL